MAKQLGKKGTDLIISYEKEVLHVYDDGFGYPTLGIGHLLTASEKKAMPIGTKITKEQSRAYFKADAQKYVDAVNAAVKVPITQNQFDALVSLAFNIGTGAIAKASLMRKLNARDYVGAADGFLAWNKVKKQAVKGLTRRRNEERKLFLTPDSAASSIASETPAVSSPTTATEPEKTDSPTVETSPTVQNADTIVNTGAQASPAVATQDVELQAPPKDGSTATAAKASIFGITIPAFILAGLEAIKGLVRDGYVDAKEVASSMIQLIMNNQKYIFMLVGLLIVLLVVKKLVKQITLWISMLTAAIPSWNTVTVKKDV